MSSIRHRGGGDGANDGTERDDADVPGLEAVQVEMVSRRRLHEAPSTEHGGSARSARSLAAAKAHAASAKSGAGVGTPAGSASDIQRPSSAARRVAQDMGVANLGFSVSSAPHRPSSVARRHSLFGRDTIGYPMVHQTSSVIYTPHYNKDDVHLGTIGRMFHKGCVLLNLDAVLTLEDIVGLILDDMVQRHDLHERAALEARLALGHGRGTLSLPSGLILMAQCKSVTQISAGFVHLTALANLGHDGHLVRSVVLVVGPSNPLSGLPRAPTRLFHQISMEQSLVAPLPGKLRRAQTSDTLDTHDARATTVGLANLYEEDSDSDHEGRLTHQSTRRLESLPEVASDDTNGAASGSNHGGSGTPSAAAEPTKHESDPATKPSGGAPPDDDSKPIEPTPNGADQSSDAAAKPPDTSAQETAHASTPVGGIATGVRRSNRRLAPVHLRSAVSNGSSRSVGSIHAGDSAAGGATLPRAAAGGAVGYSSPLAGAPLAPETGGPGAPVAAGRVESGSDSPQPSALRLVPRPKSRGRVSALVKSHSADPRASSPQVAPKAPPKKTFSARQISALAEMDKTEQSAVAGAALLQFATTMGGVLVEETFRYDLHRINTREELIAAYDRLFVRIKKHNAHAYHAPHTEAPEVRRRRASTVALGFNSSHRSRSRPRSRSISLTEPPEPNSEDEAATEGLIWTRRFAGGLMKDWNRRMSRFYKSDWLDGMELRVLSPLLYMYVATIAPTIAFGGLLQDSTKDSMGMMEVIVAQAFVGMVFAVIGGQALSILRPTGPVVAFIAVVFQQSEVYDVDFLKLWAWTGLWGMLCMLIMSVCDMAALVRYVTNFTEDVHNALIATIFIVEALKHVLFYISDENREYETVAVLSISLLLLTHILSKGSMNFNKSPYLHHTVREVITVTGPLLALLMTTGLAWLLKGRFWSTTKTAELIMLGVPDTLAPTMVVNSTDCADCRRPWLVPFTEDVSPTMVAISAVLGALLALLFFVEQNITVMLMNKESNHLKGTSYHYDMAIIGVLTGACAIFGLPVAHASLPHSVLHLQALARHGEAGDLTSSGVRKEIASVNDNRVSALLVNVLVALTIAFLPSLRVIPLPVIYGLFLFMGLESLLANSLFQRLSLMFTQPRLYPPDHIIRHMKPTKVHTYTVLQFLWLGACWVVKGTKTISPLFPAVMMAMVPFRHFVLPAMFGSDLRLLDEHVTDEDLQHATHVEHELMTIS